MRKHWSAASAAMIEANSEDHEDVLMIENDGGILVSEFNNNSGSKLLQQQQTPENYYKL